MKLVEKHHIKPTHKFYKECDALCFLSKNLYNASNYIIRKEFISNNIYIPSGTLVKQLRAENNIDFRRLPSKVGNEVIRILDRNWKSFFAIIKDWKKNPSKYLGRPGLPKYKNKKKGRNIVVYDLQAISSKELKKEKLNYQRQT